jgi:DNA-directed RNA polymerase specialized sigma24 family protein
MPTDDAKADRSRSSEPVIPAWCGEEVSDALLLERFVDQWDQAAFGDLVRRHGPMVLGVCRRILRDPHAAEDAFQATFLLLVRKAGSVRKRQSVGPWLYGVA